jgi:membrane-bound lytic murein transglycosylase B
MKPILFACLVLFCSASQAASYADRAEVQAFVAALEARHGIAAEPLRALFDKTRPLPAVLKAIAPPKDPKVRSWRAYRQRFIEPRRLAAGLEFWRSHASTLARAAALTDVPEEVIVAIIGIETLYGGHMGHFNVFAALATLAFDYPPRAELFRRELEALLLLARDEGRAPDAYRGSFAGAIGLPQFLPSSIRAYAVDFDGDGRIDLTHNPADAIGSVANFLKVHGWEAGGPVALPVETDGATAAPFVAAGIEPRFRPSEMAMQGVRGGEDAPDAPVALIDLVTPDAATEYWLGYRNFYVITRYNRSSFYAMAVYQFAQALKARHDQGHRGD